MEFARTIARAVVPRQVWEFMRSRRAAWSVRTFRSFVRKVQIGSRSYSIRIADPVGEEWYRDQPLFPELVAASALRLPPDGLVFDLGAHQSVFAMLLVDEVVPAGRVVAVEASDHNYKVGLENLRLNGKSQVELLHALVGDKEGVETISSTLNVVHSTDRGEGFGGSQVRAVTIDGLVKQYGRPDLIFMDIEGFEFVALQSKPTALQLGVSWVIELHGDDMLEPHGGSNQAFAQLFLETGYTIQLIDSGGRITTLQTIQDLPPSRCHILAIPTKPLAH